MIDLTQKLIGVVVTIASSVRADEDVPKSQAVSVFLDIDFSGCSIADALQYAAADRRIAWASSGRKKLGTLKQGTHVKVIAGAPNRVDPKEAFRAAYRAATSDAERQAVVDEWTGKQ